MNTKVDLNDERLTSINNEKQTALNNINNTYQNMINNSDAFYQNQMDLNNQYAEKQTEIQNQQNELALEQINNAQDKATRDYEKEQRGAYQDYVKQGKSNTRQMLNSGLMGTGYTETTLTDNYNTYQNRLATARESYNQTVTDYNIAKKDAILQNSSALMEIAFNTQRQNLELALSGFQYKNTLLQEQISQQNQTEDRYYSRWSDMLSQINNEQKLAEEIRQYEQSFAEQQRQYNETMAFNREKAAQEQANWEKEFALAQQKAKSSGGGSSKNSNTNPYSETSIRSDIKAVVDTISKTYVGSLKNRSENEIASGIANVANKYGLNDAEVQYVIDAINKKR